jgi:hypothetical protein
MSIIGKVLAILNVLAVIGAVVLIAQDYAKRTAWEYAVFREDLMINGLPLDEKETDPQGRPLVERIGPQTQKELFPSSPPPQPTQKAEVEQVRNQLNSKIQGAGDKKKQIYLLAQVLSPLVVTNEQRERMVAYDTYLRDDAAFDRLKVILQRADQAAKQPPKGKAKSPDEAFHDALTAQHTDPTGSLAEAYLAVITANPGTPFDQALDQSLDNQLAQLQGQLEQHFKDALDGAQAVPQRKRTIARLLFNVADALADQPAGGAPQKIDLSENPTYKRFITVVGVSEAVVAVNDEARLLKEIAAEVELERGRERSKFALEHGKAVAMIQEKSVEVEQHGLQLARQQKELAAHEEDLKKRRLDIVFYKEQLEAVRQDTAARLKELRGMSDALYQLRVKLRDDTAENQKLEKQIRTLEEGR